MLAPAATTFAAHDQPLGLAGPSHVVSASGKRIPGESLDRLERLDDTIFSALNGDAGALDGAADEWRAAVAKVDKRLLDETREHYVRRARARWRRSQRTPGERLTRGFAALEVLGLLEGGTREAP